MNIRESLTYCAATHGSAFITSPFGSDTRNALRELARICGVPEGTVAIVSDPDLLALYSVTRKRLDAGLEVAAKLARKYGASAADPILWRASAPPAAPPAAPARPVGDYATRDELAALEDTITRIGQSIRGDMYREIDGRADDLRAALLASVGAAVSEAIAAMAPLQLTVAGAAPAPVALGHVHYAMPKIIGKLAAGLSVYLHGPAGSGKTTAARKAAEALGVAFYATAKVESEYLLLGFKDAKGEAVRTAFREAYEHGGVFLFDEMDASAPGAVVAMNMALANGVCSFPDGLIKRHPQFYCIGAGNTTLGGANRQYTGRNQMDAATVDRFYFIHFGYDERLELALASNKAWARHVQAIRKYVADRGLNHLVTPRATLDGCVALASGDTWAEAEDGCIFKGLDADTVEQIRFAVPVPPEAANPLLGNAA